MDSSWRIKNSEGAVIAQGLIMEVKEDFGSGKTRQPVIAVICVQDTEV